MKSNPLNRFRSAHAGAIASFILLACGPAHAADIAATGTQATATDTWNLATWSGGGWSDSLAPSAGKTYSTGAFQIRSSASTFGGDSLRVVTGGSLLLRQASNATATYGSLILDGGTLIAGVSVAAVQNISGNVNVASDSIIDLSLAGANFRRIVLTSGGLSGSGKITINGGRNANDYFFLNTASASNHTGNWDINAGRLVVISDDQIGNSARVTLGSATTAFLELRTAANHTIGSLSGNGTVQVNNGNRTLTTGGDGTSTTFDGVITTGLALTKEGAGTFTLSNGLNSFAGAINVNGGTLEFSGTNAGLNIFGSTQININGASTLKVSGTATNVRLFDGRNYTFDSTGGGKIELGAGGNYDAGVAAQPFSITTNGGAQNSIRIIGNGVSGSNAFNLGGSVATFNVALGSNATSDLVVTPIISNNGSVVKTGAGRLELQGANTYGGTTTVNAGELLVNGSHTVTAAAPGGNGYTVNNAGSTLGGTGRLAINGNVSVGSTAILAPGASIGTLTMDGVNTTGNVLTMTTGAKFGFELAGNGGTPDQLDFWNYLAGDLTLNSNSIDLSLLGTQAAGTYNVDIFKFFSDGGSTAATHAFLSGLNIGTLGTGISGAFIDWDGTGNNSQTIGLTYTVVPEPRAALLGGLGLLCLLRRRR